jgi:hypothetical protein
MHEGLEPSPLVAENSQMAQGGAAGKLRPRMETVHWAAAATVGCVVLAIAGRDGTYLFPGGMCFALLLQCTQRLEVDGRYVRRIGLRPVVLDLSTAKVTHAGSSWWRELFLCGPALQLRDADGNRLYLESWLWDIPTRISVLQAIGHRPLP